MELRHLRYFVAVAKDLHFGRAALQLHITQPPLSAQIRKLEDELGVQLFLRTKRDVQLTPAGRALLPEALQILDQAARAREAARLADTKDAGRLIVACGPISIYAAAPTVLPAFRAHCPGVNLALIETMPVGVVEGLQKGTVDVGLVVPYFDGIALKREVIMTLPLAAVVPKRHPLAKREPIRLHQLEGEPLVLFSRGMGSGFTEHIVGLFHLRGFTPKVAHEVTGLQALFAMVSAGYGISIVPESLARLPLQNVAIVKLQEPKPSIQLCMAWRANNLSPLLKTFLEIVRRCFQGKT